MLVKTRDQPQREVQKGNLAGKTVSENNQQMVPTKKKKA